MRILLTGANGQFGMQFLANTKGKTVVAAHHSQPPPGWKGESLALDLADDQSIQDAVRKARPDWVVHGAAMTNVDACEKDPALATRVNGHAAGVVAAAAKAAGARLLYVSTDYVFDGTRGPYREGDATNPVQEYGRSKLEGERRTLAADANAVIARTAIVYGPHKKNFVTWLVGELHAGRPVRIVDDQWVTPTHTLDLVQQVQALVDADAKGVYHTAGGEGCSRLEMAHAVAKVFGLPTNLITPVKSSELQWTAKRPPDSRLDTGRIAKLKAPFGLHDALTTLKQEMRL